MATISVPEFARSNSLSDKALYNYITRATSPGKPYIPELNHPHVTSDRPKKLDEIAQAYLYEHYIRSKETTYVSPIPVQPDNQIYENIDGKMVPAGPGRNEDFQDLLEQIKDLSTRIGIEQGKAEELQRSLKDTQDQLAAKNNEIQELREEFERKSESMVSGKLYSQAESEAQSYKSQLEEAQQTLDRLQIEVNSNGAVVKTYKEQIQQYMDKMDQYNDQINFFSSLLDGLEEISIFRFGKWKREVLEKLEKSSEK